MLFDTKGEALKKGFPFFIRSYVVLDHDIRAECRAMPYKRYVLFFCMGILCAMGAFAEEAFAWPLELPRALTSSFAEYRTGRFHAGVDLRTGGIGQPVHACKNGYVSRVRCSPYGYGKAVYLTLEDGRTVVYAHLNDYAPALREYVRNEQHARETYTVDLAPTPGQFAIQCGEVIAYSGDTGIGAPHLHYEFREPDERPVNPRLLDIAWPDATPPVVRTILITPMDPSARINGDMQPVMLSAHPQGNGRFLCDAVHARGRLGFGADIIDPANGGDNILGVYKLTAAAGAAELFRVQNDYLSYDTIRHGAVSWHPYLLAQGMFLLLWRWPGNTAPSYSFSSGDGIFDMGDATTTVTLQAEDFSGNSVSIEIPLEPGGPGQSPILDTAIPPENTPGAVELSCFGTWACITASFPHAEPRPPVMQIEGPAASTGGRFVRINDRTFRAAYDPSTTGMAALHIQHPRLQEQSFRAAVFQRGQGGPAQWGDAGVEAGANAAYGTLFILEEDKPAESPEALRMLGHPYRFWPDAAPIDEPITITLPLPEGISDPSTLAIYRKTNKGWAMKDTTRKDGALCARTNELGVFAVLADEQPPLIDQVQPGDGCSTAKRPTIRASIADGGSGVEAFEIRANGQWLLAEYDPEENRLEWARDEDLPSGNVCIEFRVTDNAGNTATAMRNIHAGEASK